MELNSIEQLNADKKITSKYVTYFSYADNY